jgi:hypothetical protein
MVENETAGRCYRERATCTSALKRGLITDVRRSPFLMPSIQIHLVEYHSSMILEFLHWPVIMATQCAVAAALIY